MCLEKKQTPHIAGSHLDDGAEPAGVSHIADADRPVFLSDPVCWAAHLCLDLASLPLHPRCVLLGADLQAPGAQRSLGFKAVASRVGFLNVFVVRSCIFYRTDKRRWT